MIGDGVGRAAGIGHQQQLDPGFALQQFSGQMGQMTGTPAFFNAGQSHPDSRSTTTLEGISITQCYHEGTVCGPLECIDGAIIEAS